MAERNPCPNCGTKETVESLQDELRAVRKKAREVQAKSGPPTTGSVLVYNGATIGWQETDEPRLRFVYEICVGCGITYDPTAKDRAEAIRKDIAEAMKLIPLDLMVDVAKGQ